MKFISGLAGLILGALFGAAAALGAGGLIGPGLRMGGDIDAGGWSSDWTVGSESANPWTRARVARHGLLALTKDEAVYFNRNTDDAGDRLSEACTYTVSGGAMPAQWWSVTLYNGESYLPLNTDNALSFDQTEAGAAGAWSFTIAPEKPADGGWVSSRAAGAFDLTLRLYKPTAELIADPESILEAPRIEKTSCGEAS